MFKKAFILICKCVYGFFIWKICIWILHQQKCDGVLVPVFFISLMIKLEIIEGNCSSVKPLYCSAAVALVSNISDLWTVAHQAPQSMPFSRQEYWSGLPCPPPGDLPDPGIEPRSPVLQTDSLPSEPQGKPSIAQRHPFFFPWLLSIIL